MKRLLLLTLAAVTLMGSSRHRDAYVISRGDNNVYQAASTIEELQSVRKRLSGHYMWVRRDGREYVIRDENTLDRIDTFFAPVRALKPEHRAANREEERLDRLVDRLEDEDRRLTRDERERLQDLRAQLREASRRENEFDQKEEELEDKAERQLWVEVDSAIRAGTAKPLDR